MSLLLDDSPDWFEDVAEDLPQGLNAPQVDNSEPKLLDIYASFISKFQGLLEQPGRMSEADISNLDKALLRLRFSEESMASSIRTCEDFEIHYEAEAHAVRMHLATVAESLADVQAFAKDEALDNVGQKQSSIEALKIAICDLWDVSESVQVLVSVRTGRGPLVRVKKAFAERSSALSSQSPSNIYKKYAGSGSHRTSPEISTELSSLSTAHSDLLSEAPRSMQLKSNLKASTAFSKVGTSGTSKKDSKSPEDIPPQLTKSLQKQMLSTSAVSQNPLLTNRTPRDEFVNFVENTKKKCVGRNGLGDKQPYVPCEDLDEYWQPAKIKGLCRSLQPNIRCQVSHIKRHFLRTFSLLVYVDEASWFDIFVDAGISDAAFTLDEDSLLPMIKLLTSRDLASDLASDILSYQWLFYPLILDPTRLSECYVPEKIVLPFDSEEIIQSSDSYTMTKTVTRHSCNPKIPQAVYAIKTYSRHHRRRYRMECIALTAIKDLRNHQHIIKYYGSFWQGDTYSLVLEFVDGDNLAVYFEKTTKPTTPLDALLFWKSLSGVWSGLAAIHRSFQPPSNFDSGEGWEIVLRLHGDLKLDNILIDRGNGGVTSNSLYSFIPIISGFGHGLVQTILRDGKKLTDVLLSDRHGNLQFEAPEVSHCAQHPHQGHPDIDAGADVWSMGCIQSVAAAWAAMGCDGINTYEALRMQEIDSIINFENGGLSGCFHNGTDSLSAVARMHRMITEHCDTFTGEAVSLAEKYCIVGDLNARLSARTVYGLFCTTLVSEHTSVLMRACSLV